MDTDPPDQEPPAPGADAQLAAIGHVSGLLDAAGIDHWLFGGWAVDFWVGRITRAHHDIDLVVALVDRPAMHDALVTGGWTHTPFDDEVVGTRYRRDGVLLEQTFVVLDDGRVLLPIEPEAWVWSEQPFGDARRTLHGVTAPVVGLDVMLRDKSRPREEPDDAEKDRADHEALAQITTSRAAN
ncbi:MAG TPA: hypothetical protein VFN43_04675 [Humibacillus sp.]|nr:hypothetical protein [Humibacillus sp.]